MTVYLDTASSVIVLSFLSFSHCICFDQSIDNFLTGTIIYYGSLHWSRDLDDAKERLRFTGQRCDASLDDSDADDDDDDDHNDDGGGGDDDVYDNHNDNNNNESCTSTHHQFYYELIALQNHPHKDQVIPMINQSGQDQDKVIDEKPTKRDVIWV